MPEIRFSSSPVSDLPNTGLLSNFRDKNTFQCSIFLAWHISSSSCCSIRPYCNGRSLTQSWSQPRWKNKSKFMAESYKFLVRYWIKDTVVGNVCESETDNLQLAFCQLKKSNLANCIFRKTRIPHSILAYDLLAIKLPFYL